MTSLMGLEDKILKTELLNYEASISESKYIILISSMPKYVYMQLHLLPDMTKLTKKPLKYSHHYLNRNIFFNTSFGS